MQKVTLRKISILGLVLMAASAVTAAMVPSKADKKAINAANGSLTENSATHANGVVSSVTCAPDTAGGNISDLACTASSAAGSVTTGGPGGGSVSSDNFNASSANADAGRGADNTSSDHI